MTVGNLAFDRATNVDRSLHIGLNFFDNIVVELPSLVGQADIPSSHIDVRQLLVKFLSSDLCSARVIEFELLRLDDITLLGVELKRGLFLESIRIDVDVESFISEFCLEIFGDPLSLEVLTQLPAIIDGFDIADVYVDVKILIETPCRDSMLQVIRKLDFLPVEEDVDVSRIDVEPVVCLNLRGGIFGDLLAAPPAKHLAPPSQVPAELNLPLIGDVNVAWPDVDRRKLRIDLFGRRLAHRRFSLGFCRCLDIVLDIRIEAKFPVIKSDVVWFDVKKADLVVDLLGNLRSLGFLMSLCLAIENPFPNFERPLICANNILIGINRFVFELLAHLSSELLAHLSLAMSFFLDNDVLDELGPSVLNPDMFVRIEGFERVELVGSGFRKVASRKSFSGLGPESDIRLLFSRINPSADIIEVDIGILGSDFATNIAFGASTFVLDGGSIAT